MNIKINKTLSPKPLPFANPETHLGFGNYFSDHWFSVDFKGDSQHIGAWENAQVMPYGGLTLDPAASVFHYGQALFEGMKAFRRKDNSIWLFRPEYNSARMRAGAERLCMVAPPDEIYLAGLKALLEVDQRWVPGYPQSLYIRPTLIGSEGFLGVRPSKEMKFFIILSPVGNYYGESAQAVKIWVEDQAVRAAPGGLGSTKAGANYAASLQAALKAKEKGYSQVLWLDVHHEAIEEVGTMNIFFVFKNEIVTPSLNQSILAGGVRDSVLQILRDWHAPIIERKITMAEVLQRQAQGELLEAFGAGTAAVISPISEFCYKAKSLAMAGGNEPHHIPLSKQLLNHLQAIQHGDTPDKFGWMRPLEKLI